jgi:hypothetical protein
MSGALTQAGAKFYIAVDVGGDAEVHDSDLLLAAYEGLTWLEVKGVGNLGETGTTTNMVSYDEHATDVSQKGKGISNAGDPDVECRRIGDDPGQIQMRAATETKLSYAFKREMDNSPNATGTGTTRFNRGLVAGPRIPNGGNEDFDLEVYTLGLNQKQITKEAIAGV